MRLDDILDELGGTSAEPLSGGAQADVWLVTRADGSRVVAKTLPDVPGADDMLQLEADGLTVLRETGGLLAPRVLSVTARSLVLEAMSGCSAATADDWAEFARAVAAMHTRTGHELFGWPRDGYLGKLRQVNAWTEDGHEFFAEHRLLRYLPEPPAETALDAADRRALERLCDRLREVVPPMPAVLVHGDLWSGNLLTARDGRIAVTDPAVCYAWAETDLSMLWCEPRPAESRRFFDVYRELNPSPSGWDGWEQRMPVLHLRELLSTLAHFGAAATGTVARVRETLAPFYVRS